MSGLSLTLSSPAQGICPAFLYLVRDYHSGGYHRVLPGILLNILDTQLRVHVVPLYGVCSVCFFQEYYVRLRSRDLHL